MKTYDIAAYIWPAYTGDELRTRMFWPEGMGEWQSVKAAAAKYPGHEWPRKPLWGYVNEADPYVMEMQIQAAADHGVNVFIYDWYWFDNRPFLENCLNDGFLRASNRDRMKFYLMWANHDANMVWNKELSGMPDTVIWQGAVCRSEFEKICRRNIEKYFRQSNYYTIDGKPVFQIYDLGNLIKGLGGIEETKAALSWFREETRRAGFPDVYLLLTAYGHSLNLSGVDGEKDYDEKELCGKLGFDGTTHYQYCHFTDIDRTYADILPDVQAEWRKLDLDYPVPYYPHISIGWDNNPRYYEFRPGIVRNNPPSEVKKGLELAKAYADSHPEQAPLITINSWNEWTETSYLEPDDRYGYGYLEAVRDTFLPKINLEAVEPFACGYLGAEIDDPEYRIACGMKKWAAQIPLRLDETSVFADFSRGEDAVGIRYLYGNGIQVIEETIAGEKERFPHLSDPLEEIRQRMLPFDTERNFQNSKSPRELQLCEMKACWGGDWGGHANPDYHMLLHLGTNGLRERLETYRQLNPGKDTFYDSLHLALDVLDIMGERALEAAKKILNEIVPLTDGWNDAPNGSGRMTRIIRAFENIPQNPPRDFFEAAQFFWIASNFGGVDSPGRFDYTMGDYYLLSPEEERKEILEALWELFYQTRTWNLCIGGSDEQGNDFSNQLTYDILETARKFGYNTPNLTMRVHPNTPEALWESAVKTIAAGIGMPVLYNDACVCPALEELGIPAEDSHQYCMNGCNQIDIFGKSHMGLEDGEVCLAKCLELTLFNGTCPVSGYEMGLQTGEPADFSSFEAFMQAYRAQVEYVTDCAVELSLRAQKNYAQHAPNPYRSNLIQGCVEKGCDYKNGGPLYGHGQILAEGIADTADSLAAIRHFVFEEKKYRMEELTDALRKDFAGYDALLQDFSHYKKFGNHEEEVDSLAAEIMEHWNRYLMTKATYRGGIYGGGCSPFSRAAEYGSRIGALPSGKRASSALLADSIGAVPGMDKQGPTSLLQSVLCFDHRLAKSGFVLNMKFNKTMLNTQQGRKALEHLAKTYFEQGGQQLSIAALSAEELIDAKENPRQHENLIVRVGGYSEYFTRLSPELQENVIARSELAV